MALPEGLVSIEDYAFMECGLKSVTLPESLQSIGRGVFYEFFEMETIRIPAGVTSIGEDAFNERQTLIVTKGSYAEEYCVSHNLPYTYDE